MNVYERIVELLKKEPALQDFKYVKSKYAFIKRVDGVRYELRLNHTFFFTIQMSIRPSVSVRYDVIHKWYEKFNFKTLSDQRRNYTLGYSADMIGFDNTYHFEYDGSDFQIMYPKLREAILACMRHTFTMFATMEDYYNVRILPVFEDQSKLPNCGDDWVFLYLTASKILHPESYEQLKKFIMPHVNNMTLMGEPNIVKYKDKWDEILEYLESLDFSSGKAKLPKK